ncbi:pyridoxal-phosphate dependent enzyme [Zobellia galactanivorans]|uniref:Threonine synthase n=1 Tax=Zobellia galactanivorans (strain DSM 12802 / CCUG 47099 / CIP 106680 / NCIMB 13871 / Dsij) TaxID=63186 RepID=G0L4F5_ZOBGA|nr:MULTISPECIES: pyridoxal-phosphate dependent enzyme [Zobellia]MBU3026791.1 pyridoxal-phosphate dependent enzyme [Zobellia galactanivorans]MDO6809062.1 pyridoxal-phosphate dependent enzyme [Zobellia galactanivorans]OWW26716.1 threonine synthase [Zobellia sp. OII3]CAZ95677.1 Threonine synthase [Zobellia galactanivorans]
MDLRDGVKTAENKVSSETKKLSEFVRDKRNSLVDRLESYEDIINLEVGDTGLHRAKAFEREFDIRQLYIKYEGDNPTGTQKDRIAFAQIYDALRREFEMVSLATCGNYGVAVALAANLAGIACRIYIPESFHTDRVVEMELLGAEIVRRPGSYEDVVKESSELAKTHDWYDANPGGANTPLQISAYSQIATEIFEDLGDAPKYCAVPVSNGTLFAGIYRGFVSLYKRGKTSRIPKMVAASSSRKNPIIQSFLQGLDHCKDLNPDTIKETKYNEPLINWHSFDGEEALYALRESDGEAYNISDKKLKDMTALLAKKEGFRILPASTAGLIALLELDEKMNFEPDRFVAVLTAKN